MNVIEKEISTRIGMASQAFSRLSNIWTSSILHSSTKLNIYKSNVRPMLLYACFRDPENESQDRKSTTGL